MSGKFAEIVKSKSDKITIDEFGKLINDNFLSVSNLINNLNERLTKLEEKCKDI